MDNLQKFIDKKEKLLKLKEHRHHKHIEDIYHQKVSGHYLGDFVYGGNDGIITTFSVAAGALGASFSPTVVLVLGFANIVADGISMGVGSFLSNRSEIEYQKGQRKKEEWEIDNLRPIEVQEIREIYQEKGFTGEDLEKAVKIITANKKIWVDDMMRYELGISEEGMGSPIKHGLATFFSFIIAGLIPLSAFLFNLPIKEAALLSIILTALSLFIVGASRQLISPVKWYKGGFQNLSIGSLAAGAAFLVGNVIEKLIVK